MYKYYYNPETRNNIGATQSISVTKVDDPCYESQKIWHRWGFKPGDTFKDPFEGLRPVTIEPVVIHTVDDLCAAMKQVNYTGRERFTAENGDLYTINQNGAFEYGPLAYDGQDADFGINWAMKFFFTKEAAQTFGESLNAEGRRWDAPRYHEELDTYSVRYHR